MSLPPPALLLGTGDRFQQWYPGQELATSKVFDWFSKDNSRFMCLSIPTGSGKSLISILSAVLSGKRTVLLTATKGLQAQITKDFGQFVVDIRGQNSYQCKLESQFMCDDGPCHVGFRCDYREGGCLYYDKVTEAQMAPIVVTNYAYWLSQNEYSDGIGNRQLVILDEAHLAFQALESHLTTHITLMESESIAYPFPRDNVSDWSTWSSWSQVAKITTGERIDQLKESLRISRLATGTVNRGEAQLYRRMVTLDRKLSVLVKAKGKWVAEKEGTGWVFAPVWVTDYSDLLYLEIEKVMLMSAILTPESVGHLAVTADREFLSMPSLFPPQNTPVIHVKTVPMNRHTTSDGLKEWVNRIDQIIERRQDRKGIVFTVSYERRNLLLENSRNRNIIISHSQRDVVEMVNRFKAASPPIVLVSPSVTTGYDFPGYGKPGYIIVGKLPYPDSRSELMKARLQDDPDWTGFLAMQTLVQESGRMSRSASDISEVLIVDDSWRWFWPKYKRFAPLWFHQRVAKRSVDCIPEPPGISRLPWE